MVYVDVKHHVYLLTYWDRHIYYVTRTRRRFDSTTTLGSMEQRRRTGNGRTIPDLYRFYKTPGSSSSSSKGMQSRGIGHWTYMESAINLAVQTPAQRSEPRRSFAASLLFIGDEADGLV